MPGACANYLVITKSPDGSVIFMSLRRALICRILPAVGCSGFPHPGLLQATATPLPNLVTRTVAIPSTKSKLKLAFTLGEIYISMRVSLALKRHAEYLISC